MDVPSGVLSGRVVFNFYPLRKVLSVVEDGNSHRVVVEGSAVKGQEIEKKRAKIPGGREALVLGVLQLHLQERSNHACEQERAHAAAVRVVEPPLRL